MHDIALVSIGMVLGMGVGASIALIAQQIEARAGLKRLDKMIAELERQTKK